MAAKIVPVLKLAAKVTIAGGAVYIAYDSGLLGGSEQGSEVLGKAKSALPPAIDEWMKYFGFELPAVPKIAFAPVEAWNSGVRSTIYTLSVGPTRVGEYTTQGMQYVKDLTK
ncbi:MICOS complex subunit MIC13 [Aplochiton taeniatus]